MRRTLFTLLLLAAAAPAWARFDPPTCKNAYTQEAELQEGQKVAAEVYRQMPVLPDSDPISRYVQRIGANLAAHAPGYAWPYNFHVVASEEINAFALPGGAMFVNLGAIRAAETEAQLAGVMAHELSHVVLRHSTCNITRQRRKSLLFGLGSIASAVVLGDSGLGSLAQGGLGISQSLTFLRMSRDDEKQADLLGTDILYDSGYDPRGLPQFFEIIQAKYGNGSAQLLSDHPNPGNRTEYVNAEIATLPPRTGNIVTTTEFKRIHDLAAGQQVYTAKEVSGGGWKRTGLYASGPGASAAGASDGSATYRPATVPATNPGDNRNPAASVRTNPGNAPRLTVAQLGLDGRTLPFQGHRFFLRYPAAWQHTTESSASTTGSDTFAPAGGTQDGAITYGMLVDLSQQPGNGVADAPSLLTATSALARKLGAENSGLQQSGSITPLTLNGQSAAQVDLRGTSSVSVNGAAVAEHDRLVTFMRSDGDVSYLIFVAPEPDFAALEATFSAIAASFKAQ